MLYMGITKADCEQCDRARESLAPQGKSNTVPGAGPR